ncbi:hypothetical protein SORBI_3006G009800 [Sorghum bicolor]|uniref:Uncharacterized protein n=1 Tax=Sorghum bicolor TaxID=4558 RepID=C5YBQ6_SORBI|nr:hypothetical protein SORBI_3006G009800 [Sorghum bicolor]
MSRLQAKSFRRKSSHSHNSSSSSSRAARRWPTRLVDGFRRMLVGLFSFPPRPPKVTFSSVDDHRAGGAGVAGGGGGGGDASKRSSWSSSNLHPLNAHYDEAIADCVEFFNKSARVDLRSRPHF